MFYKLYIGLTLIAVLTAGTAAYAQNSKPVSIESGVSYLLAQYRSKVISNVQYNIRLNIPEQKMGAITGQEKIGFTLKQNTQPLQLDFKQPADHVQSVLVNHKISTVNSQQEHLIIDHHLLKVGNNEI